MITFPTLKNVLLSRAYFSDLAHGNKLPYATAIKIRRFLDQTSVINDNYNEVEKNLADQCILKDENGAPVADEHGIQFDPEKEPWFREKLDEILNSNITYVFDRDNYLVEDDLNVLSVTPRQLGFLSWMIIDTKSGGE